MLPRVAPRCIIDQVALRHEARWDLFVDQGVLRVVELAVVPSDTMSLVEE